MAVTSQRAPLLPGAIVPLVAKFSLGALMLSMLGGAAADKAAVLGADPRFEGLGEPWPFFQSVHATANSIEGLAGALPLVIVLTLILKVFIDAGTARWLALKSEGNRNVFSALFGEGWSQWWAFFRLTIVTLIVTAAGAFGLSAVLGAGAAASGGTVYEDVIEAPARIAAAIGVWTLFTGMVATWAKGHLAVRGEKRAIPAFVFALTAAVRRPLSSLLILVILAAPTAIGAVWVAADRWSLEGSMSAGGYTAAGLAVVFLQSAAWFAALTIATRGRAAQLA